MSQKIHFQSGPVEVDDIDPLLDRILQHLWVMTAESNEKAPIITDMDQTALESMVNTLKRIIFLIENDPNKVIGLTVVSATTNESDAVDTNIFSIGKVTGLAASYLSMRPMGEDAIAKSMGALLKHLTQDIEKNIIGGKGNRYIMMLQAMKTAYFQALMGAEEPESGDPGTFIN